MISLIGAVPVNVPVHRTNFHPDMGAIRSAITGRTRTIMINSPCNPTGAVYTREEIAEIVEIAVEKTIFGLFQMKYILDSYGMVSNTSLQLQ